MCWGFCHLLPLVQVFCCFLGCFFLQSDRFSFRKFYLMFLVSNWHIPFHWNVVLFFSLALEEQVKSSQRLWVTSFPFKHSVSFEHLIVWITKPRSMGFIFYFVIEYSPVLSCIVSCSSYILYKCTVLYFHWFYNHFISYTLCNYLSYSDSQLPTGLWE